MIRRFLAAVRGRVLARSVMQLALYVHNLASRTDAPTAGTGRVCGMAVGESPDIVAWDPERTVRSFAEFRCAADVEDPVTLVQLAVGKCFAVSGASPPGRTIEYSGHGCELRLALEPGFDDAHAVLEPLLQLARGLAVRNGRLVSTPAASLSV
jgi:hypothetical protein